MDESREPLKRLGEECGVMGRAIWTWLTATGVLLWQTVKFAAALVDFAVAGCKDIAAAWKRHEAKKKRKKS